MDLELETILNSLEDALVSVDENFCVALLNESAARLFGCDRQRAVGQPFKRFPALAEALGQIKIGELILSTDTTRSVRHFQLAQPAGEPLPMEATLTRVASGDRVFWTAVIRDLSTQQQMEKAVYDARKSQAVGALASGIAHDFNNILTAVISQIDLALTAPAFPPTLRDHLVYAQTSARRGAELVSKLQVFSRQTKPKIEPINLLDLIEQVVFMLKRSIDPRIQIQYLPPATPPWPVKADASYMMQALLNLGLNGRDAMPGGGTLSLHAQNISFAEADARAPRKAGDFVRLTVGDTGHGMTPEVVSRVFEPYFSTKDASRGPGLGLSITSSVVTEHGGWMEVESRVGEGTRFHVFLPRTAEAQTAPAPARVTDPKALEGRERILVVDDDELVRLVTKAVLAYRGYQIVEAEDGEQAIQAYTSATIPFDLVLMDLHMPRLNGHDALVKIRRHDPKVKAIMLSGGLHERDTEHAEDLEGVAFLHKPFENTALIRVVRDMLDAKR